MLTIIKFTLLKCMPAIRHLTEFEYQILTEFYIELFILSIMNLPKTKKFGCVGRGDLTSLFFSKVVKY